MRYFRNHVHMIKKLLTLLLFSATYLTSLADYLVIYTDTDLGYQVEVSDQLLYSFSSNQLLVNSADTGFAICIEDIKTICYSPDKVPLGIESVNNTDYQPIISYRGDCQYDAPVREMS